MAVPIKAAALRGAARARRYIKSNPGKSVTISGLAGYSVGSKPRKDAKHPYPTQR